MAKQRYWVTINDRASHYLERQCKDYMRSPSFVVERALVFCEENGIELGQVKAGGVRLIKQSSTGEAV